METIFKENATGSPEETVEFTRDVQIELRICKEDSQKSAEELTTLLLEPEKTETEITHSVQKGDHIGIAQKYGVFLPAAHRGNESVDVQNLSQGKEITISKPKSFFR